MSENCGAAVLGCAVLAGNPALAGRDACTTTRQGAFFRQELANHAAHLETAWSKSKALIKSGKLDLLSKEVIALAVSISNGCNY